MSIGPGDLLTWANGNANSADQVTLRASVSRAYYAAYHRCREWHAALPMPGANKSDGGRHDQLISHLMNPSDKCSAVQAAQSRQLGGSLSDLKAIRTSADYELSQVVLPVKAQEACAKAYIILKAAK